jgi:phage shock protein C
MARSNDGMIKDMTKKLYRSTEDRMIAGVCGGIAEYFDIDPILVRVLAVILLLPGGFPGLLPYIVLWIAVPEKPAKAKSAKKSKS